MKITFLSTFYPFRGGIAQFNALVYRALEKDNSLEAITFTRQYPNILFPGKTQLVGPEDQADVIPSKSWLDSINPFTYWTTGKRIKKNSPDLMITKYWMTFFAPSLGFVLGMQAKKTVRISILDNVIPHEKRFFDHWCNRYFLKRNDGFIVMSDKVKLDLLSYLPEAKYLHIPHPVYDHFGEKCSKIDALKKLNLENFADKKIVLFFGIIRDYKGLDLLLEAFSLLDDSFHLIVAGEVYGSFEKYDSIISEHQLKDKVSLFNNYIGDEEVKFFFSAADVGVLPYKSATQSGITSIANHFELPLIATNVGGLAETILHQKTGLIVDKVAPDALAEELASFFKSNQQIMFQSAIRQINTENTWEKFGVKLLEFYRQLK